MLAHSYSKDNCGVWGDWLSVQRIHSVLHAKQSDFYRRPVMDMLGTSRLSLSVCPSLSTVQLHLFSGPGHWVMSTAWVISTDSLALWLPGEVRGGDPAELGLGWRVGEGVYLPVPIGCLGLRGSVFFQVLVPFPSSALRPRFTPTHTSCPNLVTTPSYVSFPKWP